MVIPAAMAHSVSMPCHHPHPSDLLNSVEQESCVKSALAKCTRHYHPVVIGTSFHFPERRLIQYDCGMYG